MIHRDVVGVTQAGSFVECHYIWQSDGPGGRGACRRSPGQGANNGRGGAVLPKELRATDLKQSRSSEHVDRYEENYRHSRNRIGRSAALQELVEKPVVGATSTEIRCVARPWN